MIGQAVQAFKKYAVMPGIFVLAGCGTPISGDVIMPDYETAKANRAEAIHLRQELYNPEGPTYVYGWASMNETFATYLVLWHIADPASRRFIERACEGLRQLAIDPVRRVSEDQMIKKVQDYQQTQIATDTQARTCAAVAGGVAGVLSHR